MMGTKTSRTRTRTKAPKKPTEHPAEVQESKPNAVEDKVARVVQAVKEIGQAVERHVATTAAPQGAELVKAKRGEPRTECKHGHGPEQWRVSKSGKSSWCVRCDQLSRERLAAKEQPVA